MREMQSEQSVFNNLLNREESLGIEVVDSLRINSEFGQVTAELDLHPELEKYDRLYETVTQIGNPEPKRGQSEPWFRAGLYSRGRKIRDGISAITARTS